jgi:hypothetical protein
MFGIIMQYLPLYIHDVIFVCVTACTPADPGAHIVLGEYQPRDSGNHKPGLLLR